jgi:hypothetical protein
METVETLKRNPAVMVTDSYLKTPLRPAGGLMVRTGAGITAVVPEIHHYFQVVSLAELLCWLSVIWPAWLIARPAHLPVGSSTG